MSAAAKPVIDLATVELDYEAIAAAEMSRSLVNEDAPPIPARIDRRDA